MNILITNDDGISSPGLSALVEALKDDHDVWILAPDGERSGASHSITLKGAMRVRKIRDRMYSCGGTPADCVLLSCLGALPAKPDMVIAGINLGPNLGTDIIYSGTAAAARQAALMGVPGIAVSLSAFRGPYLFDATARFIRNNAEMFFSLWTPEHFLNINTPNIPEMDMEVQITQPSRRIYNDKIVSFPAPDGDIYYFLQGDKIESDNMINTDWEAVLSGKISVTPVYLQPMNHSDDERYLKARFNKPNA